MALTLREDFYFCLTDRSAIFLDLAQNRYFGLTGTAELALRSIVKGDTLEPHLERALRPLQAKGLIVDAEPAAAMAPPRIALADTALAPSQGASTIRLRTAALGIRACVEAEVRLVGLKTMMRRRRTAKARGSKSGSASASIETIVAAHLGLDRLLGGADRCLTRSIALIDHLSRHGHYPDLVIGVRTGAFSAHCWVQAGTSVLNDAVDRVRLFTPIFVL